MTRGKISGGYKKYIEEILPRFNKNPDIKSVLIIMHPFIKLTEEIYNLRKIEFFEHVIKPFNFRFDKPCLNKIQDFKPSIIFFPSERYLPFKGVPIVNMVQNMEPFAKKNKFNSIKINVKLLILKLIGHYSIKKADGTLALSQYTVSYLKKTLKISSSKIALNYHGANLNNLSTVKPKVIQRRQISNFIFTAGSIRPARGLEDILRGFKILNKKNKNIKLIIAGSFTSDSKKYFEKLKNYIQKNKLNEYVIWTGSLNQNEMYWCYQNCKAFVMTSRVEAFGIIAIEAMLNGCVCISSDSPCLPEIFDKAALYYNEGNSFQLYEKLEYASNISNEKIKIISKRAKNRAKYFSWDISAKRTVKFLTEIIERKSSLNGNK